MTPRQRRSSAVDRSTIAFLCGLCGVEELPGSFLIEVFGALGMSISGARSYLARAVADGRLASHRHGRQTLYSLNGTLLRRYRTVRRDFNGRPSWNGHFHIAIYNIPEARRPERDALRAAAFDEGWASPRPGVLLGIQPPGIWADRTDCSTGRLDVDLSTARELAASAWPLDEAAQQIDPTPGLAPGRHQGPLPRSGHLRHLATGSPDPSGGDARDTQQHHLPMGHVAEPSHGALPGGLPA